MRMDLSDSPNNLCKYVRSPLSTLRIADDPLLGNCRGDVRCGHHAQP
jgi:hypothetical protein